MRRVVLLLAMAVVLQGGITHAQTQITVQANAHEPDADGAYSAEAFAAELDVLSAQLEEEPTADDVAKVRNSLPKSWTVKAGENQYVISSEVVDKALAAGNTDHAMDWLNHMSMEAHSVSANRGRTNENARAELNKILSGQEFAAVHRPTWWDLFRQRLAAWIERMLGKLFGRLSNYPITGQILFWGVLILALGFIAMGLIRFLVNRDRIETLTEQQLVTANRTWQEWIRLAREAAGRKDYREAVHAAYWAGIARLEDIAVVPKDRTKTPREYLRMVAQPAGYELGVRPVTYREPLTELTKRLERTWYANRGAGPEDYEETLKQLQEMGCQLE